MSDQIEQGLARAEASTADFDKVLEDFLDASSRASMFYGASLDYGDLFNEATDLLCGVMTLRKKFCETAEGNAMKYTSPTNNEFEVVIKGLNMIRCQISDYMAEAKQIKERSEKECDERKEVLKAMADLKEEAKNDCFE